MPDTTDTTIQDEPVNRPKTFPTPMPAGVQLLKVTSVFFLITLFAQGALAQDNRHLEMERAETLTLEQAIEVSLANNSEMRRALFSVLDADEEVRVAWSELLPNVSATAGYTRNIEIPVNFLPAEFFGGEPGELIPVAFGTDNNWTGGVTVSQNIFRGEAIVGVSSSALFKSAQQENMRTTAQHIVTRTRKAYYRVLVAEEQLRLQQAAVDRIEENLRENRGRYRAGMADEYDVLRLEVQLANQKPLVSEARFGVEQAYRELKLVLGVPVEMPLRTAGDLNRFSILPDGSSAPENASIERIDRMTPLPSTEDTAPMDLMRSFRGDLRVLRVQGELVDREIMAIRSRFLPTVTANYNLQWVAAQAGSPRPFENAVRFQTVGLTVSVPLFEGMQRRAVLEQARINRKDVEEQRMASERAARNEFESSVENLNRIFETASALEQAVDQARRGYEIARQRFSEGMGSQTEVTEAELQVREAEINYARMIHDYLSAKADYDLALGMVPLVDHGDEFQTN